MKKVFLMLTIAAFTTAFVACNSKKNETKEGDQDSAQVDTPAESSKSDGDLITQYSDLIEKAITLYPKVKDGDASAIQEYTKLSQEISAVAVKLGEDAQNMTPEQAAKMVELGKKFADVATAK